MKYKRMPIEVESPEELGYSTIRYNLSESSVADRSLGDLGIQIPDLKLLYGEHRGDPELRALIASEGAGLGADDVLITSGAAGALFVVATALLGPEDNLVVVRPNYATNLETPRAIGCSLTCIDLKFENGFKIDFAEIAAALKPNTKLLSVTNPHNPTGITQSEADLRKLAALAKGHGIPLLVDETYRDLSFGDKPALAATLDSHVITVCSLSKAYGVPGLRVGWIINRDAKLKEQFLAAKEQISICGSVIDEYVAREVLKMRTQLLDKTMAEMRRRRAQIEDWMSREQLLEWVAPSGGVVCFPRMRREPPGGTDAFYKRLLGEHGTYVGPGHWFELPDTHFRLGFGWPTADELTAGLEGITKALRS
jgi:aspartate/methionine/tyrosine aminotransferase